MNDDIRKRMFNEMEQKFVFEDARNAAYSYADQALERNVFPCNNCTNTARPPPWRKSAAATSAWSTAARCR